MLTLLSSRLASTLMATPPAGIVLVTCTVNGKVEEVDVIEMVFILELLGKFRANRAGEDRS